MRKRRLSNRKRRLCLTKKSEIATIVATFIAVLALTIAALSAVVAIMTLRVQLDQFDRISRNIEDLQPIQVSVSLRNEDGTFTRRIQTDRGERLFVQISFGNISEHRTGSIGAQVVLPPQLSHASDFVYVYSRLDHISESLPSNIANAAIKIGDFSDFADGRRSSGTVSFEVTLSNEIEDFDFGLNQLEIIAFIGNYVDGTIVSDASVAYAYVDVYVLIERPWETPQAIQLNAGVHDGIGAFIRRIDANHGDELLVQFVFANASGVRMNSIEARVILPDALELVPDSVRLFNHTNPHGTQIDDAITTGAVNLGAYNPFDGEGRGQGSVSFRIRVSDDDSLFILGVPLNIRTEITGYIGGMIATDTFAAYTAVDVVVDR